MRGYLAVFAVAAFVTAALIPVAIRIAIRFGIIAEPDAERRLHPRPTPVLGGFAMCVGACAAILLASHLRQFHEMFSSSSEALGVVVGALVIVGVGFLDDVWEVSAPAKLAGQVLAGSAMYLFGLTLDQLQIPFGGNVQISADLAPLFTVLWVVGIANAINLIDGLDGLAAGIVGIASVSFLLYSTRLFDDQIITGSNIGPLIAAVTAGICAGFLPYNFTPAKIFMGDAGSMLLGLLVAVSTMVVGGRAVPGVATRGQRYFFFAPLLIPFLLLAVPVVDTVAAIVRRTINRSGFATADRQHIHYRLLELGHGPRRAVVILWAFTALLSGFALVPVFFASRWALAPLLVGLVGVVVLTLWHPDLRAQRRARRVQPSK